MLDLEANRTPGGNAEQPPTPGNLDLRTTSGAWTTRACSRCRLVADDDVDGALTGAWSWPRVALGAAGAGLGVDDLDQERSWSPDADAQIPQARTLTRPRNHAREAPRMAPSIATGKGRPRARARTARWEVRTFEVDGRGDPFQLLSESDAWVATPGSTDTRSAFVSAKCILRRLDSSGKRSLDPHLDGPNFMIAEPERGFTFERARGRRVRPRTGG